MLLVESLLLCRCLLIVLSQIYPCIYGTGQLVGLFLISQWRRLALSVVWTWTRDVLFIWCVFERKNNICILNKSWGCYFGEDFWIRARAISADAQLFVIRYFCSTRSEPWMITHVWDEKEHCRITTAHGKGDGVKVRNSQPVVCPRDSMCGKLPVPQKRSQLFRNRFPRASRYSGYLSFFQRKSSEYGISNEQFVSRFRRRAMTLGILVCQRRFYSTSLLSVRSSRE